MRSASKNFAFMDEANSKSCGIDSIRYKLLIYGTNYKITVSDLTEIKRMKVKSTIIEHFLKSYLNIDKPKKYEKEPLILHELIERYTNFFSISLFRVLSFLLYFCLQLCSSPL